MTASERLSFRRVNGYTIQVCVHGTGFEGRVYAGVIRRQGENRPGQSVTWRAELWRDLSAFPDAPAAEFLPAVAASKDAEKQVRALLREVGPWWRQPEPSSIAHVSFPGHVIESVTPGADIPDRPELAGFLLADCSCGAEYTVPEGPDEFGALEEAHKRHVAEATGREG
jgi:hypothetical protein